MKKLFIFLILWLPLGALSETKKNDSYRQEMEEMKDLHFRCKNSHKKSAECHEDFMKACDLGKDECLKVLERMNFKAIKK